MAAVVVILASCALLLVLWAGARINTTSSFPRGIYWVVDKSPVKGDLVLFCPPRREVFHLALERGYLHSGTCPGGYMRMLKRLVAVAGDDVWITLAGVSVNGQLQQRSQPLLLDPGGRAMPQPPLLYFRLARDEVLLMSDYSRSSFDGRYFGAIPREQLGEVVRPWLVWGQP